MDANRAKVFWFFFSKKNCFLPHPTLRVRKVASINILSIQSWVAYGHVGNASALFPLQRLGAETWAINTVQFSNHPGYGHFTGEVLRGEAITALIDGIAARGVLPTCDAVLSGYIGAATVGNAILDAAARVRAANPAALYACDPVIGDDDRIYVGEGIPAFFRDRAVAAADVLTPNQFELRQLTGQPCDTLAHAKAAIATLRARMPAAGPRVVLVTSLRTTETPAATLDVLVGASGGCHLLRAPLLPAAFNGAGDTVAALFLFHLLDGATPQAAMQSAVSAVHGLLRQTLAAGTRELQLVQAQNEFVRPSILFEVISC